MTSRSQVAAGLILLAGIAGIAGCEDAARKSVVHAAVPGSTLTPLRQDAPATPARAPNTVVAADKPSVPLQLPPLPVFAPKRRSLLMLPPALRGSKEELIARVEQKFASGEQNYKAGHLEAARKDFDEAVDWMLESGFDLNADAKLSELFHRVVDTVYADELQAFRAGDGFQEAPAVPAPIVETGLRRAGRYRQMISRVLQEEGMPQDLIYLAQAESAFQPLALSRAGARGIWQFVAYRGHEYGLRHTWWIDERQDPEKATHAAAQHLRDLYKLYGDWYLAMAAYNCGPGNVQKGIERTGYADFWELYKRNVLPRETKNYV